MGGLELRFDFALGGGLFAEHRLAQSVGSVVHGPKGHGIGDQGARNRHRNVGPQRHGEGSSKRDLRHRDQEPEKDAQCQAKCDALSTEMPQPWMVQDRAHPAQPPAFLQGFRLGQPRLDAVLHSEWLWGVRWLAEQLSLNTSFLTCCATTIHAP